MNRATMIFAPGGLCFSGAHYCSATSSENRKLDRMKARGKAGFHRTLPAAGQAGRRGVRGRYLPSPYVADNGWTGVIAEMIFSRSVSFEPELAAGEEISR